MKTNAKNNDRVNDLRKKLLAALAMLLVAVILTVSTSMAWFVLSSAPEVTGIATNIGANGALEIALLNTNTYQNLTQVKTTIGQTLASDKVTANTTWGNLIDLSDKSYGLGEIQLLPSRLNLVKKTDGTGYTINDNMLKVPTYAYDGRIEKLADNTMTAIYKTDAFTAVAGKGDYGVRAIGTSDTLTPQGSALALAKNNISTFTNSARNGAASVLQNKVRPLLMSIATAYATPTPTFSNADVEIVKEMVTGLKNSASYIEQALRQSMIAIAASAIEDETTFITARDTIADTSKSLSSLLESDTIPTAIKNAIPTTFKDMVTAQETLKNDLDNALAECNKLNDGSHTKEDFMVALGKLMDPAKVLINDTTLENLDSTSAGALMSNPTNQMVLAPGSGAFATIADFAGNYSATISLAGTNIDVKTTSAKTPDLETLKNFIDGLEPAGDASADAEISLGTTYGYAIDLAFRTNAQHSNLLLQTAAVQRINEESTSAGTMGGGSYMEFDGNGKELYDTQLLMDAVRVTFIDSAKNVLAIAKLNVTGTYADENGMVKAPLYLYDYALSTDPETLGAVVMGERKLTENAITSLQRNTAKAVTAIVWLDGDIVDNSMVSADDELSLSGKLNLQFASDVDLRPYVNADLLNYQPDKTGLDNLIKDCKTIVDAGQLKYTTLSWTEFNEIYKYADALNKNVNANDSQIYNTISALNEAKSKLVNVSPEALKTKIDEVRKLMGKTTDQVYAGVYRVDYNNNLKAEGQEGDGNDIKTMIYTDLSWSALANTLYDAEVVYNNKEATEAEIDGALLILEASHEGLQRNVYYMPCDLNGQLYYFAISDETDTYGKWYDSSFKRIVSDRVILELDAYATKDVSVAQFDKVGLYKQTDEITPETKLLDEVYPSLKEDKIMAAHWVIPAGVMIEHPPTITPEETHAMDSTQKNILATAIATAKAVKGYASNSALVASVTEAQYVLYNMDATYDAAAAAIEKINAELVKIEGQTAINSSNATNVPLPGTDLFAVKYNVDCLGSTFTFSSVQNEVVNVNGFIVTEKGVITKVEQRLEIYRPADGAEIKTDDSWDGKLIEGQTKQLISALTGNGHGEEIQTSTWSSSDTAILKVSGDGLITAVKDGVATVNVVCKTKQGNEYTAEYSVTVTYNKASGVSLTGVPGSMKVKDNATASLALTGEDHTEEIVSATWETSDDKIAKVVNGKVTAVAVGNATIKVTVTTEHGHTHTATASVTVTE